ncbi:hypothetical protein RHSIM_Rhsim11G0091100 [Rhododendron simsii]|uniref:Retrotransposon gag domain-containing protein n=1 Tax=Rhododendron simsii TaxID=118357 RepID=A0A834G7Q4_RHOSS|nr:hypothetical protein RHSIM_Rhsim11G0091100 [Rhododendron simsii]
MEHRVIPEGAQPPPPDRLERMERILEGLLGVMAQQNQPRPVVMGEPARVEPISIKDFQKMKPPTFEGGIDGLKAYNWVQGEVHRWWLQQRKREQNMNWVRFKEVFYEKYFPQTLKDNKCTGFINLKQGDNMTVSEYDKAFTDLSQFAPHMISTENLKARRFEEGLKDGLRKPIKMLRLPTYTDVLNVALMSETDNKKPTPLVMNKGDKSVMCDQGIREATIHIKSRIPEHLGGVKVVVVGEIKTGHVGGVVRYIPGNAIEMLERVIDVDRWDI